MKRMFLALALTLTACNCAIGLTYAAICQGSGGARACGSQCTTLPGGDCGCGGACTKAELDWVAGAHGNQELLEEVYDY